MAENAGLTGRNGLIALAGVAVVLIGGGVWYAGVLPDFAPAGPVVTTPHPLAKVPAEPAPEQAAVAPEPEGQIAPEQAAVAPEPEAQTAPEQAAIAPEPEAQTAPEQAAVAPEPEAQTAPEQAAVASEPEGQTAPAVAEATTVETALPDPVAESALPVPQFDVVRVEPDGNALIAGTAAPGATVTFFLDAVETGSAVAGPDGKFASFLTLEPSAVARLLTMTSALDTRVAVSADQIILAPAAPVEVAETARETAEPEAGTAPEPSQPGAAPAGLDPAPQQVAVSEPAVSDTAPVAAETVITKSQVVAPGPGASPPTASVPTQTAPTRPEQTPATSSLVAEQAQPGSQAPEAGTTPSAMQTPAAAAPVVAAENPTGNATKKTDAVAETAGTATADATVAADTPLLSHAPVVALTAEPKAAPAPAPAPLTLTETTRLTTPRAEPAPAQGQSSVAVLRAGKDGVELLQPATPARPDAMQRISLDTISYSEAGEVQLSGRAKGQSVVRVYLDNQAVADLDTDGTGKWKGQLGGIKPGIYTLRLDELGDRGQVLSRLETPFKREAPDVLNPPQPENAPEQSPLIRAVTVQQGDTLWAISRDRYGEGFLYVRVFEANKQNIRNPDLIYPGQVFAIPD